MKRIEKINRLLQINGKDQKYLSEVIGISTSAVSQWNTGKTSPTNRNLKKIADHFGVDVADLLDDEKTPDAQGDGRMLPEEFTARYWSLSARGREELDLFAQSLLKLESEQQATIDSAEKALDK